jgi:hypothetical protein
MNTGGWARVLQGYARFDTSSLGTGVIVTGVALSLYQDDQWWYNQMGHDTHAHTMTVRNGLSAWHPMAPTGHTVVATTSIPAGVLTDGWVSFTSESVFPSLINRSGTTYLHFSLDYSHNDEGVVAFQSPLAANTYRPKIVVTYVTKTAPVLTTNSVSSIAWNGATAGGNITSDGSNGENPVTDRGVCWNTTGTPTVADSHTHDGTGTGAFTSAVTGLAEATTYHLRAYAINSIGTAYGAEVDFTTPAKPTFFLAGAIGRTTAWNRALTPAEVLADMDADQVIYDRSLSKGTVVISGTMKNRKGASVPAHHVRAGWLIQNNDYQPDPTLPPPALYITGHSVDLAGKKNALTIGKDWMEEQIGVRMAELLAIPGAPEWNPPIEEVYQEPEVTSDAEPTDGGGTAPSGGGGTSGGVPIGPGVAPVVTGYESIEPPGGRDREI